MGRHPKPDHLRRNRNPTLAPGTTILDARAHAKRAPKWPLLGQSDREKELWRRVWRTPQSVMWERAGWSESVARYVRLLAVTELGGLLVEREVAITPSPGLLGEVRQLEDRLGLSPLAMLRLRWVIQDEEVPPAATEGGPNEPIDIRDRLKAAN